MQIKIGTVVVVAVFSLCQALPQGMCTPHFGNGVLMGELNYYYRPHYKMGLAHTLGHCHIDSDHKTD